LNFKQHQKKAKEKTMSKPFLSPSAVSTFVECPRCFYLDRNMKISRPRGIFPSLPGGIDNVMKIHHDSHRPLGEVPFMIQEMSRVTLFPDQKKMNLWRNWRTGMKVETPEYVCGGAVDDVAVEENKTYSPYDFKSKGSEPDDDYPAKYYQNQVNIYALMLESNGFPASGKAYFRFAWPVPDSRQDDGIGFKGKIISIPTDTKAAHALLLRAAACLASPSIPEAGDDCGHCKWVEARRGVGC
jgi:hypothetical protein